MAKDSYYQEHQKLLKETLTFVQKEIPEIRMFERHVGVFKTMNDQMIRININGMADVWFIYPTEAGCIYGEMEFKTGKAGQSKAQKTWQKFIESMNATYLIVRDKNEALKQIKKALEIN